MATNNNPIASKPVLKMRKPQLKIIPSSAGYKFQNDGGKLVCFCTKPSSQDWEFVDVELGPYAKLDELAAVISILMGNVIRHGGV